MKNGVFATWLKRFIDDNGLNQSDVAERLKEDRSTIGRWLNGERKPTYDQLQKVITVLHVNPQVLFDWK